MGKLNVHAMIYNVLYTLYIDEMMAIRRPQMVQMQLKILVVVPQSPTLRIIVIVIPRLPVVTMLVVLPHGYKPRCPHGCNPWGGWC